MAGKVLTMHEQARIAVAAGDRSVDRSALARELGMSRQWLGVLIGRFEVDGFAGLAARSRAPRAGPRVLAHVEDAVVRFRKELSDAGLSAGPGPIRWHLERAGVVVFPLPAADPLRGGAGAVFDGDFVAYDDSLPTPAAAFSLAQELGHRCLHGGLCFDPDCTLTGADET